MDKLTRAQAALYSLDCIQPFWEAIVTLLDRSSLSSARLASRQFRASIDANIRELKVIVTPSDEDRRLEGQLPSLARWNVTKLHIVISLPEHLVDGPIDFASLATLPLRNVSLAAKQQITELEMDMEVASGIEVILLTYNVAEIASSLVAELPRLKSLNWGLPCDDQHRQQFYAALANIADLQELTLPCQCALVGIGALASTLRSLVVNGVALSRGALAHISQLANLQTLEVAVCNLPPGTHIAQSADDTDIEENDEDVPAVTPASLKQLLDATPLKLCNLYVDVILESSTDNPADPSADDNTLHVALKLHNGALREAHVRSHTATRLPVLSRIASQLLACRPLRTVDGALEVVSLLGVDTRQVTGSELRLLQLLQPLPQLLWRSKRVEVCGYFLTFDKFSACDGILDMLGKPQQVLSAGGVALRLREPQEPPTWAPALIPHSPPQMPKCDQHPIMPILSAQDVARRVLEKLTAVPLTSAEPTWAPTGYKARNGDNAEVQVVGSAATADGGLSSQFLLLRGPCLASFLRNPTILHKFLCFLNERATLIWRSADGQHSSAFASYIPLPMATSAVVLDCGNQEAAAAMAVATAMGFPDEMGHPLRVRMSVSPLLSGPTDAASIGFCYLSGLSQVLQDVWETRNGPGGALAGGAFSERALLQQLLGVGEQLSVLPTVSAVGGAAQAPAVPGSPGGGAAAVADAGAVDTDMDTSDLEASGAGTDFDDDGYADVPSGADDTPYADD